MADEYRAQAAEEIRVCRRHPVVARRAEPFAVATMTGVSKSTTTSRNALRPVALARKNQLFGGVLPVLCAALSGCFLCPTHYRASGIVVSSTGERLPDSPPLSAVVGDALRPLGFSGPMIPAHNGAPEGTTYYNPPRSGFWKPDTNVSVGLETETHKIFLFDFNSPTQTDFARRVQKAITDQVRLTYHATINFEPPPHRVPDCLGP